MKRTPSGMIQLIYLVKNHIKSDSGRYSTQPSFTSIVKSIVNFVCLEKLWRAPDRPSPTAQLSWHLCTSSRTPV